jgi:hypothetical protein
MSSNDHNAPATIQPLNPEDERLPIGYIGLVAIISAIIFAVGIIWAARLENNVRKEVAESTGIAGDAPQLGNPEIGMVDQQLYTVERRALDERRTEHAQLDHYGWVDRASGKVHIPIAEAMKKVAANPQPFPVTQPMMPMTSASPQMQLTPLAPTVPTQEQPAPTPGTPTPNKTPNQQPQPKTK